MGKNTFQWAGTNTGEGIKSGGRSCFAILHFTVSLEIKYITVPLLTSLQILLVLLVFLIGGADPFVRQHSWN